MDKYNIDSHKLMYHPERVIQVQNATTWEKAKDVYPIYVEISPVGACNHRCTFCAVDYLGYKTNILDYTVLTRAIKQMSIKGIKSIMYAGEGEPLLHKEINRIVERTRWYDIDVAFTTNGVLLDKLETLNLCQWIKVSINAGTKETYAQIHRTKEKDWDKVWANLEAAVLRKGNCVIGVQAVLLPGNASDMYTLAVKCRAIGLDYLVIKPYSQHKASINRMDIDYTNISNMAKYLYELNTDAFQVVVRESAIHRYSETDRYDKCKATPFLWAYIMATGDVYGCSAYLLDDRFNYGNINDSSFQEIWTGKKREANYHFVTNDLDISDCRKNCRMESANVFLTEIDTIPHKNFI